LKTLLSIYLIFIVLISFSQQPKSALLSDCFGSLELSSSGTYKVSLTGGAGIFDDLFNTTAFQTKEENSVWFRIEFQHAGDANIQMAVNQRTEFAVFQNVSCEPILEGKAKPVFNQVFMNDSIHYEFRNTKEGDVFYVMLNTIKSVKEISLIFWQNSAQEALNTTSAIRLLDRRLNPEMDYLLIKVRDVESGAPVTGQIVIRELNRLNALYSASDLIFPKDRTLSFNISIDAFGYFPYDNTFKFTGKNSDTLLVQLVPVQIGKQIEIEGIEFFPQSNKLLPISEERLKRIRDFLIFNEDIKIEIQGHVHHVGRNGFASKRLSRRRAQSVKDFLVKNGIDKNRLLAVGYGNTQMRYPNAQSASEERANRRVEVRIIE
jgi:outer membrane protein OmpA-like peptidoglycan-associated protein